jgi:predicted transcriptional regulator YdeE
MKFQRHHCCIQKTLSDNIYYRNVNNNAGIFDYIIGAAEDQECKEAFPGLLLPACAGR